MEVEQELLQNKVSDDVESFESCTNSFIKLRTVITQWLDEVKKHSNMFADVLLSHIYRWLSSGEAKLFDPQLFNFVNNLMQKCFTELLNKFKALGANIVFSSFNRIIIETKKPDVEQARNYVTFIIDSIMRETMFKYLRMHTIEEWKTLMFKDRFNYGGIREESERRVTCNFDLKNHLPDKVSKIFLTMIGEFILKNYNHSVETRRKVLEDDPNININVTNPHLSKDEYDDDPYVGPHAACKSMEHLDTINDVSELEGVTFAKQILLKDFTKKLFEIIEEINNSKHAAEHQYNIAEKDFEFITEEE
jgi:hypothetical protein